MSYRVGLQMDTGGAEPAAVGESFNCTYNCHRMFALALDDEAGIRSLDGMPGGEAALRLDRAAAHMAHPDNEPTYRALNPANGWGDHPSALRFLRNILEQCQAHPKATVYVH